MKKIKSQLSPGQKRNIQETRQKAEGDRYQLDDELVKGWFEVIKKVRPNPAQMKRSLQRLIRSIGRQNIVEENIKPKEPETEKQPVPPKAAHEVVAKSLIKLAKEILKS